MKKTLIVLSAALLAFAACEKEEAFEPAEVQPVEGSITASIEVPETKVYLNWDNENKIYRVTWEGWESVSLFRGNSNNLLYNISDGAGTTSATFVPDPSNSTSASQDFAYDVAVFPYDVVNTVTPEDGGVKISVELASEFKGAFNFPMVAVNRKDASSNFVFKNVVGGLEVILGGYAEIASVELMGNNGEIVAGKASIHAAPGELPRIEMDNSTETKMTHFGPVQLKDDQQSFIFGLPPMTFSKGISITVRDTKGNVWTRTSETPLTIERSVIPYLYLEFPYRDTELMLESLYESLGAPGRISSRADDFGFIMMAFSNDVEGPDLVIENSGYNWFSTCGELTSHTVATYANPSNRYRYAVNLIRAVNSALVYCEDAPAQLAQLKALRAYAYMQMVQDYQFTFAAAASQPGVPILPEDNYSGMSVPCSTVAEVYDYIISDLNYAVENLSGYVRPSKKFIDRQVALGLRARAELIMGRYNEAFADASAAAEGYTPASIEEVSKPSFMSIDEHNWLWGYDMTEAVASEYRYATSSSWVRSFSAWGYSAGVGVYSRINTLLYNKIDTDDVRKGWWVNENLESPLLDGLSWDGNTDVARYESEDKMMFQPYTNVKFGCDPVGTTANAEDFPFMRVEEMLLIQAEALVRLGDMAKALQTLNVFIGGYRQPGYTFVAYSAEALLNEIWRQRRIELWGEGFGLPDVKRLMKPLVRFHGDGTSNMPAAYSFNVAADDPVLLMLFTNSAVADNPALPGNSPGSAPVPGQNPDLRDGVTD